LLQDFDQQPIKHPGLFNIYKTSQSDYNCCPYIDSKRQKD